MAPPRRPGTAVAAIVLVAGLAGCTGSGTTAGSPATTTPTSAVTSGAGPAAAPTPTPAASSAAPTAVPVDLPTGPTSAPTEVRLTEGGIGGTAIGSPDAYDALVAVLGAPTEPIQDYCMGAARMAEWGGLTAYLHTDGALIGWSLEPGALPDVVRPPHDIHPGDALADVLALGGAPEPLLQPQDSGQHVTTVDGIAWGSEGATPQAPIAWIAGHAPGCS